MNSENRGFTWHVEYPRFVAVREHGENRMVRGFSPGSGWVLVPESMVSKTKRDALVAFIADLAEKLSDAREELEELEEANV